MRINFTARHTDITPEVKKYCEKRLNSIEKLLGYSVEADLRLSVEKYRHKAEIRIRTKGATLISTKETHDMFSSVNVAFDHIEKRVKKEKDKLRERKRRKVRELEIFSPSEEKETPARRVIRSRNYSLKPMLLEEALIQLESSKKEIFVFREFDSEKWTVLYNRKDGNYGMMELE